MKVFFCLKQGSLTFSLKYFHRKYINLRQITPIQKSKNIKFHGISKQSQQIAISSHQNGSLKLQQLTEQQKFKHETLKIGENIDKQQRMSKQMHQINYTIKNTNKIASLFHIIKKKGHLLTIKQCLSLFSKFNYLDKFSQKSSQSSNSLQLIQLQENSKYNILISCLEKLIMQKIHPPQIYIKFIHTFSQLQNEYVFNRCYNLIFIKLLKQQLVPQYNIKQLKQRQTSSKEDLKKQISKQQDSYKQGNKQVQSQLSQVISIQDNIKLVQAMFRIFNDKKNQPHGEEAKLILSLIRKLINYIHLPSTPLQVSNSKLQQLILQYILGYPKLKLNPQLIKSISKEVLRRVKNEGVLQQVEGLSKNKMVQSFPESKVVNSLKRLLTLQKLHNQQYKQSSLNKQLLQSKPGSLPYHPFYALQQRVHKYIVELLPKCHFRISQFQSIQLQQNPWKHQQLVNLLKSHVKLLFITLPIQCLVKCQLLHPRLLQYEAISVYLKHLYEHIIYAQSLQLQFQQKLNYWRLLSHSYKLLYLLLSPQIRCHIPAPIVNKAINESILNNLIKYFSDLPKELQIIVVWYVVQNQSKCSIDESVMNSLFKTLVQSNKNNLRPNKNIYKVPIAMWYIQLLAGNQNYTKHIEDRIIPKQRQKIVTYFQTLFKQIGNYQFTFIQSKSQQQLYQHLAHKIVNHINKWSNNKQYVDKLMQIYKKNSMSLLSEDHFSQQQIQFLKNHSQFFRQTNSVNEFISNKSIYQLRSKLIKRINSTLAKAQLILQIIIKYYGENNQQSKNYILQIMEIFQKEYQSLKYNGLITSANSEALGRINKFKKYNNQQNISLSLNSQQAASKDQKVQDLKTPN